MNWFLCWQTTRSLDKLVFYHSIIHYPLWPVDVGVARVEKEATSMDPEHDWKEVALRPLLSSIPRNVNVDHKTVFISNELLGLLLDDERTRFVIIQSGVWQLSNRQLPALLA